MKTSFPHTTWTLLLAALSASSFSALAQSIPVVISGEIKTATCTPVLSGTNVTNSTIQLPDVQLTELDTVGKTAGPRTVTFTLPGCDINIALNNMWVHFEPNGSTVIDGRLVTSNPQVHFEIRNDTDTGTRVHFGGTAANTGPVASTQGTGAAISGTNPNRTASKDYVFLYYAAQVVSNAGALAANATYTVKYY